MSVPRRRPQHATAPDSLIKKADDRHHYGDVPSEPVKDSGRRDVAGNAPRPTPERRKPKGSGEQPYDEPAEKNETPRK
jgi:hypothetical protein